MSHRHYRETWSQSLKQFLLVMVFYNISTLICKIANESPTLSLFLFKLTKFCVLIKLPQNCLLRSAFHSVVYIPTSYWQTLKLFKYYYTMRLIVCTGMDNLYSNILNKYTLKIPKISHSLTTLKPTCNKIYLFYFFPFNIRGNRLCFLAFTSGSDKIFLLSPIHQ